MSLWQDKRKVGGCNFCNDNDYRKVLEFRGKGTTLVVRFCKKCLARLNRLAR